MTSACRFFGAADFGVTAIPLGNYLANDMGRGVAQGVLNIIYIVSMIPSLPPFEYASRHALDSFLCTFLKPEWVYKSHRWRNVILASIIYFTSLGLAELFPGKTTIVVQITSAFGVLGVSCAPPAPWTVLELAWQSAQAQLPCTALHSEPDPQQLCPDTSNSTVLCAADLGRGRDRDRGRMPSQVGLFLLDQQGPVMSTHADHAVQVLHSNRQPLPAHVWLVGDPSSSAFNYWAAESSRECKVPHNM